MFVWFVYPFVPRHFGGGEVVYVNIGLVPTFDVKQINITNPLNAFLIYQSADSLFILTLTGDSFLLKRSDVAYVKYLESNKVLDTLKNSVSINNSTSTPR